MNSAAYQGSTHRRTRPVQFFFGGGHTHFGMFGMGARLVHYVGGGGGNRGTPKLFCLLFQYRNRGTCRFLKFQTTFF